MKILNCIIIFLILSATSLAVNIIITPDSMYSKAVELKQIHTNNGITSEIVNISTIQDDYNNNITIDIDGSDTRAIPYSYDSATAKKIINYLQTNTYDYVTLFGDSSLIPPSYYIYNEGINQLDSWIPTDSFYTSTTNTAIGRIPVKTPDEAGNYLQKLNDWYSNANINTIALAGSDTNNDKKYYGELITLEIAKLLAGKQITKLYRTNLNFKEQNIKDILQTGNTGLVYIVGHGSVNSLNLDDGILYSSEIEILSKADFQPIILSSLCSNGAFDTRITGQQKSIGESMITSQSGSIAFIGTSRLSYGLPVLSYTNGVIDIEESAYASEIMESIIKEYKDGETIIGNMVRNALDNYITNNNMGESLNKRTLFEFILLGDPTLKLPAYTQSTTYTSPGLTALNPTIPQAIPFYNIPLGTQIIIDIETNSPQTKISLFTNNTLQESITQTGDYTFTPLTAEYLIIAENPDEKETRLLLNVSAEEQPKQYSLQTPLSIDFPYSERNETITAQFNITNNGDLRFNNLSVTSDMYNIIITPSVLSLDINQSAIITVTTSLPLYVSSGIQTIGYLRFKENNYQKVISMSSDAANKIRIAGMTAYVDGKKRSLSEESTLDVSPESTLNVEVEVENLLQDYEIDSAIIIINISDIEYDWGDDEYNSIDSDSDTFSIGKGKTKKSEVSFILPRIVDSGVYTAHVLVEAIDDNGASHFIETIFYLNMEKETHDIRILKLGLDKDMIDCDDYVELYLTLVNMGEKDEDVTLLVTSPKLGIGISKDVFLASEIELDINIYSETIEIRGKNLEQGDYPINIAFERDGDIEESRTLYLKVTGCQEEKLSSAVSQTELQARQNIESLNQQVYTKKQSFKETSTYKMLIAIIAVLWIGFIIFLIGALVISIQKRK